MSDRLARGNPLLNTDAMLAKVVPPSWQSNSLAKIASQIRIETEAAEAAAQVADVAAKTLAHANHQEIQHRMAAGDLLIEAKAQIPHGEWLPWLESNLAMSDRSARVWMQLARGRDEIGSRVDGAANLSVREALKILSGEDTDEPYDDPLGDDDPQDDPLSDDEKDKILALKQNYDWGPEAIAKTLKLPEDDVRRFLQPDDDNDKKPRKKRQQLGGSGDDEYFTPSKYVEVVRDVLGEIDLDPASCLEAQVTVRATRYYTKEDDGLNQPWSGRIFLNPTWSAPLPWVQKLIEEYQSGRVTEAIMLTNSSTSTEWFQTAAHACTGIGFTDHNIAFIHKTKGQMPRAAIGQAFFYFSRGPIDRFVERFSQIGYVVPPPLKPRTAHIDAAASMAGVA